MNLRGAVGRERNTMLIPYSWVQHTDQELIDAFVIFFGHMVIWQTRTNEEYEKYHMIIWQIYNIVPDEIYELTNDAGDMVKKADQSFIYKFANRKKVELAQKAKLTEFRLVQEGQKANDERVKRIDLGALVGEFQDFKMQYFNQPEEMRKDFGLFMDDYIAYVYSKTSQKEPNKEDYCCFWSFDEMRKLLNDFDGLAPVAKKVYSEYRDYIMTKK